MYIIFLKHLTFVSAVTVSKEILTTHSVWIMVRNNLPRCTGKESENQISAPFDILSSTIAEKLEDKCGKFH